MQKKCAISGRDIADNEGIAWMDLRDGLKTFIREIHADASLDEHTFISYHELNTLLRSYIAELSRAEVTDFDKLNEHISQRFKKDETLKPINHKIEETQLSFGDRLSDSIAEFGGSWSFIISFFVVLFGWMALNAAILHYKGFDPYPFILLNLALSCLAAIQAPIILMSQNREADKDRLRSEYDFKVNLKAETEVRLLHEKIDHLLLHHTRSMMELLQLNVDLMEQMNNRFAHLNDALANKDKA